MDLSFSSGENNVVEGGVTQNNIYTDVIPVIVGTITNPSASTETILSITIDEVSITASDLQINGSPVSFPYSIGGNNSEPFSFKLSPSGVIGNSDTIKFTINATSGSTEFIYAFTEIDPMTSFGTTPNPYDLGTIYLGNAFYGYIEISNTTCYTCSYDYSTDLYDTSWAVPSPLVLSYGTSPQGAFFSFIPTVTSPDLSVYSVYLQATANGGDIGLSYSIPFAGQVVIPPVFSGESKLSISNSISFM